MEMQKSQKNYFVGLDIGTDSVGYAVADTSYALCKFHGEPMWGVTLFDEASGSDERRAFRTARRRLDRRQQRVRLLGELFAADISKVDPSFFIRLRESSLLAQDTSDGESFRLFTEPHQEKAYHEAYPTIHHLLMKLMEDEIPHDVREVYLACQWLVAHRGHFLNEVDKENIEGVKDFGKVYTDLVEAVKNMTEDAFLPWDEALGREVLEQILRGRGVNRKSEAIKQQLFGGKVPKEIGKDQDEDTWAYRCDHIFKLLCGGSGVKLSELFGNEAYAELETAKVSLDMEDDVLAGVLANLEDREAELLRAMKAVYDWSVLIDVLKGGDSVSAGKVQDYEQHQTDLKLLKRLVKKYLPSEYDNIFRSATEKDNYVAYSYHLKGCPEGAEVKKCNAEAFCDYLKKKLSTVTPDDADKTDFDDMMERIKNCTFMPKQKNTNNRVIPYQLYWYELNKILQNAQRYLPFLGEADEYGTVAQKILSIFEFRIPYYVGPLRNDDNDKRKHAWIVRKAGKIYPWNFDDMVDLDASENAFIRRMTNTCTYMPGEDVLPKSSLCYSAFMVLNAINNITINGVPIPVEIKKELFFGYCMKYPRLTKKGVCNYLISKGNMTTEDKLDGIDTNIGASLQSFRYFESLINEGILSTEQVEHIIERATYSEDKSRLRKWLREKFPHVSENDVKYILGFKCNDFGRLSKAFLCDLCGVDKTAGTGESHSIMEMLWETNCNLMQLLSDRFTFTEQLQEITRAYYAEHPRSLSERLDEMYVPNAVKRPIIRTMDILRDVVKIMGHDPERIFVEMARGATEDQKKKRTQSRVDQVRELYAQIRDYDLRELQQHLDEMGDMAENRLQSDKIFLYFMQLGRCMYCGEPIDFGTLISGDTGLYNIDHIYPQSVVKDDSILKNKVLVCSVCNGQKSDIYPIASDIQGKMGSFWTYLHKNGLLSDEKYKRLTRTTSFTDEEKYEFINRQLVETRQSTKAVATLLKEMYPNTEIVYVKAGLVSDFRQEFDLLKSREYNDLHHAKDAYLNIVVGNVYHCKFSRQWFKIDADPYSMKVKVLFTQKVYCRGQMVWNGWKDVELVQKMARKPYAHLTRYAFCRKGGFFDQMPLKAAPGLTPLKQGKPTEIYGGYNKPTASFFVLVRYTQGKKRDVMIMPVELLHSRRFLADPAFAEVYAKEQVEKILGKPVTNLEFLLNRRILKVNTMLSLDGFRVCLAGKSGGGRQLIITSLCPFVASWRAEDIALWIPEEKRITAEKYIKKMESFMKKKKEKPAIQANEKYDGISSKMNIALYDLYTQKMQNYPYSKRPANPCATLVTGREKFASLGVTEQVIVLMQIQGLFGRAKFADLTSVGGVGKAGVTCLGSSLSNWKKSYADVRIIDASASGLHEQVSQNLLELL